MISKELLSEILGNYDFSDYIVLNCELSYHKGHYSINIYELAHKCKERAYKHKGLVFSKHCVTPDDLTQHTYSFEATGVLYRGHPSKTLVKNFIEDTEPEAIFKATSYIIEQLKELEE